LVIKNSRFLNNKGIATNGDSSGVGTAIIYIVGSNAFIDNCLFGLNSAEIGASQVYAGNSSILLSNCTISSNKVTGLGLGCGVCLSRCSAVLNQCNISYNQLPHVAPTESLYRLFKGGGLYIDRSNVTLKGCSISHNTGGYGGAIYNNQGNLVLDSCEVLDNTALTLELNGDESGGLGGGIYNNGTLKLRNTSIAKNSPDDLYPP
jgi:hypothetical protein